MLRILDIILSTLSNKQGFVLWGDDWSEDLCLRKHLDSRETKFTVPQGTSD